MSLAIGLESLCPNAAYMGSLTDDTQASYDALEWLDNRPKPLYEKVLAASLIVVKDDLKAYASKCRRKRRDAGFTFRGMKFDADDASVSALANANQLATANISYSAQWKLFDNSFVNLDSQTIKSAFAALTRFVEALYNAEATLSQAIDVGSVTTDTQVLTTINSVPNSV